MTSEQAPAHFGQKVQLDLVGVPGCRSTGTLIGFATHNGKPLPSRLVVRFDYRPGVTSIMFPNQVHPA